ncbi:MAG: hypothetical protein IT368_07975 [Candidatus Hydrogenedentes bacterium]|nr:hypothetical protein [Candidatus Hydrogenedentota bacterium]
MGKICHRFTQMNADKNSLHPCSSVCICGSIDFYLLKFLAVVTVAIVLIIAAMAYAGFHYYAAEPILVVLPISTHGEEGRLIPIVLPPGQYYFQIGLRDEYLERIEQVALFGTIALANSIETPAAREVNEVLDEERISLLQEQARNNAKLALASAGERPLPYPWTTILPKTVAIPLFPPFPVEDTNEVLEVEMHLEVVDQLKAGAARRESGDVFLRIERYFDAL